MISTIAATRRRLPQNVLADGAVAYWRLNSNSNDETGTYNGTAVGSPSYVDGAIAGNSAIALNGTSQYAKFGDILDTVFAGSGKSFTIEAWVNIANNDASTRAIVAKLGDTTEDQRQFAFVQYGGKIRFVWYGTLASGSARVIETASELTTGEWYHAVATFTAANTTDQKAKIYINGVESWSVITSFGSPTEIQNGTAKLSIGAALLSNDSTSRYFFGGSIDEVAIYPTALSSARILAHYQAARPPS